MAETKSPIRGMDAQRLARIKAWLDEKIAGGHFDGAALTIVRGGGAAHTLYTGYASRDAGEKLTAKHTYCTMSLGKQFIATLILNRMEAGCFRPNTQIREIVPEFAKRGKEDITIFHLLTQTSGLNSLNPPLAPERLGDLDALLAWIYENAAESTPGHVHYSAVAAHAVMADILQRTDKAKRPIREILEEDLFMPLGMTRTSLGGRDDLLDMLCPVKWRGPREGIFTPAALEAAPLMMRNPKIIIPAGGYISHIEDIGAFIAMFLNGGAWNGARILSPPTIARLSQNQTGSQPGMSRMGRSLRGWPEYPANLGLGFFVRGERMDHPAAWGSFASPGTFGGFGQGTTGFWVDPAHDLGMGLLSIGSMEDTDHLDRLQSLSDLVRSALID